MSKLWIRGGNRLHGTIRASGAKNSVLKLMAACILSNDVCTIRNVPDIIDVHTMIGVLNALGIDINFNRDKRIITMDMKKHGEIKSYEAPYKLVKEMRASIQIMGPLLARVGKAKISYPGGCDIGSRPIDYHLNGFKILGARVHEEQGYIIAEAKSLKGAEITLDFPSVGATENLMAAATLAKGTTIIHNAAREPEIVEQQKFYNAMGGRVSGAGTDKIIIQGVDRLGAVDYTLMADRIEVGTIMVAAAITEGDVLIEGIVPEHIRSVTAKLIEAGTEIRKGEDWIQVIGSRPVLPIDVQTMPYPGFPTDMQPQIAVFASLAKGASIITETVFTNRFKHVDELRRMGADIRSDGRTIFIRGVPKLSGTEVKATDLRAGAAMVLAGLIADGVTIVEDADHIDRGYEAIEDKLSCLGAEIRRIKVSGEREMAVS